MKVSTSALGLAFALLWQGASVASSPNGDLPDEDWYAVEAAPSLEGTKLLIAIGRALDVQYRGGRPSTELRYSNGHVSDGEKVNLVASAETWKSLVLIVHKHVQKSGQEYLPNRTAPGYYHEADGFGEVDRYIYHIFIVPPAKLRFDTISKYELDAESKK